MTPIPLNLPLRAADAAELGRLLFDHTEPKPLTAEIRRRLASRAAALRLESVTPFFGSLVRDAVHPSVYYLAVDATAPETGESASLLLHIAPAAAPTSSVFRMPLLIGRVRTAAGRELVINAIPFGPADEDALQRFAAELDPSFLPQARGLRPAIAVTQGLPEAFAAFRKVWKRTGVNLAAVTAVLEGTSSSGIYNAAMWAAIREGWREGYSLRVELRLESESLAKDAIAAVARFSYFAVDIGRLLERKGTPGEFGALRMVTQLHQIIREMRSALRVPRAFDFELSLESAGRPIAPADLIACLDTLKESGCAAQFFRPPEGSPIPEMAAAARESQCLLSLRESVARTPRGPMLYQLTGETANLAERIALTAEYLVA